MFSHVFMDNGQVVNQRFFEPVRAIIPEIMKHRKFVTGVYHVNGCNGKTVINDNEIPSKDNQLILFNNEPHFGTVQTDTDIRVVLNFNLITE